MSNSLYKILITLILIVPIVLKGQQYQVSNYGPSDGLSDGPKRQVVQDSSGYLWINSLSGINRFDGNEFKIYSGNPNDTSTFTNPEMHASYVTDNGILYVAGKEGLFRYDKKKDKFLSCMTRFEQNFTDNSNEFTDIIQVSTSLYITSFIGLHEYDLESQIWTYYDLTPEIQHKNNHHSAKVFRSIIKDKTHPTTLFIGGKMQIATFDTQKKQLVHLFLLNKFREFLYQIHNMTQLNEFEYLLSTWGVGTLKFDTRDESINQLYINKDLILDVGPYMINTDLEFLNDSTLIITNNSGDLISYDLNMKSFSKLQIEGLEKNNTGVFKDRDGIFWLSNDNGLTKLSIKSFEEILIPQLNSRSIFWAIPDDEGTNIIYFIGGEKAFKNTIQEISEDIITSFDGPKWVIDYDKYTNQFLYPKTNEILAIYDVETHKTKTIQLEKTTNYLDFICTKNEYIASYPDNIVVYDKKGNQKLSYKIPSKRMNKFPYPRYDLSSGKDSIVYVYGSQFIYIIDRKSGNSEFIEINGVSNITGLHDVNGVLWLANRFDGISKFTFDKSNEKYVTESVLEKDKHFTARHSTIDENGIIWMSVYSGIKGFDTKSEKMVYNLEGKYNFSKVDEPIHNTKQFLFTSTDDSFIIIDKDQKSFKLYGIELSTINVDNKLRPVKSSLTLPSKERNISFNWNTIYFGPYDQLSFYTKLNGWDDDWVYQGTKQSAFYPHLPYGDYEFQVRVEGPRISEIKTLITFTIKTPWWRTKLFLAFVIGAFLASLYFLYKWRMNAALYKSNIDKKMAELELKALRAQLNPHFIFNSLNSIKTLIQKNENPQAIEYVLVFSSMIRNVLDLSDKQEVTLSEELEFSEQYLKMEKLRFMDRFDYSIEIEDGIELDYISVPPMILQPHLENSLWHGIMPLLDKKGTLILSVSRKEHGILISIEDNGIGRIASSKINAENNDYKHNAKGSSISIDRIKLNSLIRENDIIVSILDKVKNEVSQGTLIQIQISKISV
ncbi:MAG: ligand-binding sensor domain-containing protein [Saprospiraceae bacterium]